jgi:iron complex outermembrane recepter protein
MKRIIPRIFPLTLLARWLCLTMTLSPALAQSTAATIEGRVVSARSGEYLEKARLTVEGTSLEAFTNSDGQFRLVGVPSGSARIRVFFTGLEPATATVAVVGGRTLQHDFTLKVARGRGGQALAVRRRCLP